MGFQSYTARFPLRILLNAVGDVSPDKIAHGRTYKDVRRKVPPLGNARERDQAGKAIYCRPNPAMTAVPAGDNRRQRPGSGGVARGKRASSAEELAIGIMVPAKPARKGRPRPLGCVLQDLRNHQAVGESAETEEPGGLELVCFLATYQLCTTGWLAQQPPAATRVFPHRG